MTRLIDADALKKEMENKCKWLCKDLSDILDNAPTIASTKGEWIPVTSRPMTKEEEKEVCEQWGVKELEGWEKRVFTCPLPEDGQEILISTSWGVRKDKCEWDPDSGCGLEENGDWDGIKAWMPLPKQYEEEPEDDT